MSVRFFHTKKTQGEIRMTDGSLWKNMLLLSIPLMLSQLLQVLFNMADVAVVGKFSSAEALGAVGSTTILVSLFTGFLIGMGSAVNVRVAQHLGAREKARTSATIRTSFIICLATGCIITVLCLLSARFMLELLGTKEDLIEGLSSISASMRSECPRSESSTSVTACSARTETRSVRLSI